MEQDIAFWLFRVALWMTEHAELIVMATAVLIIYLVGYFTCFIHERIEDRLFT